MGGAAGGGVGFATGAGAAGVAVTGAASGAGMAISCTLNTGGAGGLLPGRSVTNAATSAP